MKQHQQVRHRETAALGLPRRLAVTRGDSVTFRAALLGADGQLSNCQLSNCQFSVFAAQRR